MITDSFIIALSTETSAEIPTGNGVTEARDSDTEAEIRDIYDEYSRQLEKSLRGFSEIGFK